MFCPQCGSGDQEPETFCRQCGRFLPDFEKLKSKEIPPEEHLKANNVLILMSAIVSATLAILLHAFFTAREDTPILIRITAGLLTAMFFWQAQTFWRNMQLKNQLPKSRKKHKEEPEALDTNPLVDSVKAKGLLNESDVSDAVPQSAIENTTKHLVEKMQRDSS